MKRSSENQAAKPKPPAPVPVVEAAAMVGIGLTVCALSIWLGVIAGLVRAENNRGRQ